MAAADLDRDERIAHLLEERHLPGSTIRNADTLWQTHPDVAEEVLRLAVTEAVLIEAVSDWQQPAGDETRSYQAFDATTDHEQGRAKSPPPLVQVGRYRILRLLGKGGMGEVHAASDPELQRSVAIKLPHFAGSPDRQENLRRRFLREARSAAAVEHSNVCPIYDVSEHEGRPFVVMGLIDGEPLTNRLRGQPPIEVLEAVSLAIGIAAGLAAVHAHGIVHRDLKPGNILLRSKDGEPVLTDFGLAQLLHDEEHLTADGTIVGTPAYMSPEQANPGLGPVTVRSDLYSLGVILFEMVTGRLPFAGSVMQIIAQLGSGPIPRASEFRADLDPALDAIIARAMARQPEERFADAGAFADALSDWLEDDSPGTVTTWREWLDDIFVPPGSRRRNVLGVAIVVGLFLLCNGLRIYLTRTNPEPSPRQQQASTAKVNSPGQSLAPVRGAIDIKVWRKNEFDPVTKTLKHPGLRLNHPDALPLAPGDWMRIEVELNRPAYCYVVWIDTEGQVTPLYPWGDMNWQHRPQSEQRRSQVSLPEGPVSIAPLGAGPAGMETLLLLTRDEPLPSEIDLAKRLGRFPRQKALNLRTAAWFENGALVRNEVDRGPIRLDQAQAAEHPTVQTQALVRKKLGDLFGYTRAVSFSNRGD